MAVPSSGQLRLYADIGVELGVPQSNVSLGAMSNSAGFSEPDSMSEFYGYVDAIPPSVTTNNISNIGETSLTINGNITSDGGATISERGFYFGTNSSSPTNNTKYTVSGTTGYYSNNRTGLNDNTTYYCWAFATNSAGTTYGSRVQATTIAAFNPIFSAASTIRVKVTNNNSPVSNRQLYNIPQKMYRNPYTNALVVYGSLQDYQTYSYNQGANHTYDMLYVGQFGLCSNAINIVGADVSEQTLDGQARTNGFEIDIERQSSFTISNTSTTFLQKISFTNVDTNTSTQYRVFFNGQTTVPTSGYPGQNWSAYLQFNYS